MSLFQNMSVYEQKLFLEGFQRVAGVDEAGRGPLAGPVVAACCVLPRGVIFEGLNDSKKLSSLQRNRLYKEITEHPKTLFGIASASVEEIDTYNILQATFLAMQRAVQQLSQMPDYLLIDGNRSPFFSIPLSTIVEGDSKSVSIAAASILAKVTRDLWMEEIDASWPQYGFKKHKGYGTPEHKEALIQFGRCPIHRKTFQFHS
jgi:ribonuclease HII